MALTAEQQQDISATQNDTTPTRRATVPALESMLYEAIPVLDHGFVRLIDYMGDDSAIVQAARVSYGKGTKHVSQDKGLINYLMRHWHSTPFEMCEIKLHVKLPIFVARQWIRHRTANVNEYSARYSVMDKEFYVPAPEHMAAQSKVNNQGRGDTLSAEESAKVIAMLRTDAEQVYGHYEQLMNADAQGNVLDMEAPGIARELARMNLTLNYYTQWYWKIDLHNLMHFVMLRADPHAQYEIRVYADAILKIMEAWVPLATDAFKEHRMHGMRLSRTAAAAVKRMIAGETVTQETSGLSKREWDEMQKSLGMAG